MKDDRTGFRNGSGEPFPDHESSVPEFSPEQPSKGRKRGELGHKICGASCVAGGTASAVAIGLCTAAVCALYGAGALRSYAIGFPSGTVIESVSQGTDGSGRPVIDAYLGDGSDGPAEGPSQDEPSDPDAVASQETRPGTPDADPEDPRGSAQGSGPDTPGVGSEGTRPGYGPESQAPGTSGGNQGGCAPGTASADPAAPMPDMGEDPTERVTALMESELLRARAARIASGMHPYPDSDIAVPSSTGIPAVAEAYGFSEGFLLEYNSGEGSVPGLIMVPAV